MSLKHVLALTVLLSGCADALAPAAPGSTDGAGPFVPGPAPGGGEDPAPSTDALQGCRTLGPVQHLGLIYQDPLSTTSLPVDARNAQLATSAVHNHVYIWSEGRLMMINNVGCLAATMEVNAEPVVANVIGISAGPEGFIYIADRPFDDERVRLIRFDEVTPTHQAVLRVDSEVSEHVLPEGSTDEDLAALFIDWEAGLFYVMGEQLYEGSFGGDQELVAFGPGVGENVTDATLAISADLLVLSSGEVVQASGSEGIGGLVSGATYRVPGAPEGAVAFAHDNSGVYSLVTVDETTVSLGFHACQR